MARYRAGDWKGAVDALEKWAELQAPGHGPGTFVLAMALARLGDEEMARAVRRRAVQWMDQTRPDDPDLQRFRAEAEDLLD
jgi:hypothetical protein